MGSRIGRAIAALATLATAVAVLTACGGSERSVEAFCSTMDTHKQRYLEQMSVAQSGGIGGIFTAVSAVGDLKLMWRELAEVAPADIQADAEAVRDAWEKQEDNAAEMDWAAALATGLLNSGSMSRVDQYVRANCDGDYTVEQATSDELVTEQEETPSEQEPVPTPEPVLPILTDEWPDRNGYTYTFALESATGEATKDVANAKPGEANISWSYALKATIGNTTPERNAPQVGVLVQPMWPAGSALCSAGSMGISYGFSSNSVDEDAWCTLSSMPVALATGSAISMGSSVPVQGVSGGLVPLTVPEASADAIIADLLAPAVWVSAIQTPEPRTECLIESGSWYMSASSADTGCRP